ncbi:MAG: hypothetical protein LBK25_08530 [Treponema sp.]|nr:hypothetical protein [Treponema sp.]
MFNNFTTGVIRKVAPLTPHPSGVRRLHMGCCTKGSAADPDLTVTLVNKRNLLGVRESGTL